MAEYITLAIVGFDPLPRFLYVSMEEASSSKIYERGIGIDGSSIPGLASTEESDIIAVPERDPLPCYFSGDFREIYFTWLLDREGGEEYPLDLRKYAKGVDKKLEENNLKVKIRPELEFYVIEDESPGYFAPPPKDELLSFRESLVETLEREGIGIRYHHHENGPGQMEIELMPIEGVLRSCDILEIAKLTTLEKAREEGLSLTFMPKPFSDEAGSGMHLHFYLENLEGKNLVKEGEGISKVAMGFIAGVLERAREICVLTNPTINSYKRLWGGMEAPNAIAWGRYNRTAMVRIPASTKSIEVRNPDAMAIPYLAIPTIALAGLEGILKGKEPPKEIRGSAYERSKEKLPRTLSEALLEFKRSDWTSKVLGEIKEAYVKVIEKEILDFLKTVTDWELTRYF